LRAWFGSAADTSTVRWRGQPVSGVPSRAQAGSQPSQSQTSRHPTRAVERALTARIVRETGARWRLLSGYSACVHGVAITEGDVPRPGWP
jgi:hypothetical protein